MSNVKDFFVNAYQWIMAHPKTSLLIIAGVALAAIVIR